MSYGHEPKSARCLHKVSDDYLTGGAKTFSFELHAIDTLEINDIAQVHPGPFQPPVGQSARGTAIDFLALRLHAAPLFVFSASSGGISNLKKDPWMGRAGY